MYYQNLFFAENTGAITFVDYIEMKRTYFIKCSKGEEFSLKCACVEIQWWTRDILLQVKVSTMLIFCIMFDQKISLTTRIKTSNERCKSAYIIILTFLSNYLSLWINYNVQKKDFNPQALCLSVSETLHKFDNHFFIIIVLLIFLCK